MRAVNPVNLTTMTLYSGVRAMTRMTYSNNSNPGFQPWAPKWHSLTMIRAIGWQAKTKDAYEPIKAGKASAGANPSKALTRQ